MRTPERIEKDKVRDYLESIGAYQHWPVQQGFGRQTLDCIACVNGHYVGIEVKSHTGNYTARQRLTMKQIVVAGGGVFGGTADQIIEGIAQWLSTK
jgi:hypothetical protein